MKIAALISLPLLISLTAQGDFSYTTTRRTSAGASVAGKGNQSLKYYFKGRKMKVETGEKTVIMDFSARTITTVDSLQKTILIKKLEAAAVHADDVPGKVDVQETGRKKMIGGYNCSELVLTTPLDSSELRQMGSRFRIETDLWISEDVPGAGELHRFYIENGGSINPAALVDALGGGGNSAMQAGLGVLHRRLAGTNGVPVLEVVRVKSTGSPEAKPLTPAETGRIRDTIAELDAKVQKGGPEAAAATREMSRLKAMVGDDSPPGGPAGSLFEITMESTGFSVASIPDSVFAVPDGYRTEVR